MHYRTCAIASETSSTKGHAIHNRLFHSLLAPLIGAFQASYPKVRVQVFITDRIVDQIAGGVDLAFKVGEQLKDSSLVARRILS